MTVSLQNKLNIPSSYEHLADVERMIEDVCDHFRVNEDYFGNILVAVTEAVNNAIQHGNKSNPGKKIEIEFSSRGNELCFRIKDEGEGFDYNNLPDPTDPQNIEKINGRGVFLMKNLADDVNFFENGRIVELNFRPVQASA